MADGDAAVAAGYTVAPNTTAANLIANLIARVQDDVANKVGDKGAVIPVAKGGTGGATAAAARTALGVLASADVVVSDGGTAIANKVPRYTAAGRMIVGYPSTANDVTNKAYVDTAVGGVDLSSKVSKSGDTMTGNLFLPNASGATSGYTVAYINGDGRVCEGVSSARFKDNITAIEPVSLGDLFPQLHTFTLNGDPDGTTQVGYIAEHLEQNAATLPFVVFERNPVTDDDGNIIGSQIALDEHGNTIAKSIDFIPLLLAQVAQLHQRVLELEAK